MTTAILLGLMLLGVDEPKWELAAEEEGFKIYSRKRPGSEVLEMKAVGMMDATAPEIWKVVRDYPSYPKTLPYVEEAKILERENDDKIIILYSRISPPLVDQRDYVIRITDDSDWKDGAGFMKASWTVAPDKESLKRPTEKAVRLKLNDGYWLLEPKEGGKKTQVTYYLYTSPGGSIPNWIANKGNSVAVPKVFESVKKTIASDREKAKK